jgi:hypothetical protein
MHTAHHRFKWVNTEFYYFTFIKWEISVLENIYSASCFIFQICSCSEDCCLHTHALICSPYTLSYTCTYTILCPYAPPLPSRMRFPLSTWRHSHSHTALATQPVFIRFGGQALWVWSGQRHLPHSHLTLQVQKFIMYHWMLHSAILVLMLTIHMELRASVHERGQIICLEEFSHRSRCSMIFNFLLK